MDIHYHWHNIDHSDSIQEYAYKKINKLANHFDIDFAAVVRFKSEKNSQFCELAFTQMKGLGDFVASASHDSLYAAIDLAEAKLEKQIRRHKEKITDRQREV